MGARNPQLVHEQSRKKSKARTMKGSSYDDISLKDSYAAYDIDIDDLNFSDVDIPATKTWDDDQMLMNLIDAHALIAEIAIQLGSRRRQLNPGHGQPS